LPGVNGRIECDSHADTSCAGKNCVVLSYTNQVIDVFGFHDSLGALKAIPIASVATLATDTNGNEVILVIHEALYFGDKMQHTLLSVNQARAYDVSIWDNPCDPNHSLSIEASGTTVEMRIEGIVVYADTRSPTADELKTLPHVELTSSATWNPLQASYQLHPMGVEYLDEKRTIELVREDIKLLPSLESKSEFPCYLLVTGYLLVLTTPLFLRCNIIWVNPLWFSVLFLQFMVPRSLMLL